jgi:hypothetical protein
MCAAPLNQHTHAVNWLRVAFFFSDIIILKLKSSSQPCSIRGFKIQCSQKMGIIKFSWLYVWDVWHHSSCTLCIWYPNIPLSHAVSPKLYVIERMVNTKKNVPLGQKTLSFAVTCISRPGQILSPFFLPWEMLWNCENIEEITLIYCHMTAESWSSWTRSALMGEVKNLYKGVEWILLP